MNTSLHSPPRPLLLPETPFSQRKRTPFRASQPPKAPAKSCPPVSRVFPTPRFSKTGPRFVSFKSERKPDGKKIVLIYFVYEKHDKWYGNRIHEWWILDYFSVDHIREIFFRQDDQSVIANKTYCSLNIARKMDWLPCVTQGKIF